MQILKVTDEAFRQYGKVIKDLDVSDIITAMSETPCPDDVVYEPSIESLEACKSAQSVSDSLYGGMPIQIGYCNGHNHLLNAVEYHRDSEINIAVTDLILILGKERRRLGITQAELAERADVSLDTIKSVENGRRAMSLDTYLNIVHALESSPTVLMSQQHPEKHIERFAFMMNRCDEREIEFALHMIEQILRGQEDYLSE